MPKVLFHVIYCLSQDMQEMVEYIRNPIGQTEGKSYCHNIILSCQNDSLWR